MFNQTRGYAIAFLIALCSVLVVSGCGGGRLISQSQEVSMGQEAADQFEAENGGRDHEPAVVSLVSTIAHRITEAAKPPDYPYEVRVLANSQVNAVAFPGGRIYLFRGLVDKFNRNPDHLAWVAGHETTHVAHQHAVKRIEQQLGYQAIIALVLKQEGAQQIASAVASLMLLSYSRDEEFEADRGGMAYTHAAGYDPTAAVAVLEKFQEIQGDDPSDFEIMFETHPGNTRRLDEVRAYLRQQGWHGKYYQY